MDIPFDCCLYSKEDVKFDKVFTNNRQIPIVVMVIM